jgi:ketosteroid isomerase-like protein
VTFVTVPGAISWRSFLPHVIFLQSSPVSDLGEPAMSRRIISLLILILCALAAIAQSDPRQTKLLILERMWNEAQVNRDAAALDALVGSRFVNTEWDGEVSDKQHFLADIKDPLFKPTLLTIQDVKMSFFGDTAIVTGTYHAQGTYQGKAYDHVGRFTDTWVQDSGKWQCVASHTSLIKK